MAANWRIEALMKLAVQALALSPSTGQGSGRVRDMPDIRMIRYYTTIGLIDRPDAMRGRTAYYGPKHLRQLVAIKRLQAKGLSLVEVQKSLAGVSVRKLNQHADLPAGFLEAALTTNSDAKLEPPGRSTTADSLTTANLSGDRLRFWSAVPAAGQRYPQQENTPPDQECMLPRQLAVILPLDAGVSLVLEGVAPEQLSKEVVASLQPAVAALREALVQAGLWSA